MGRGLGDTRAPSPLRWSRRFSCKTICFFFCSENKIKSMKNKNDSIYITLWGPCLSNARLAGWPLHSSSLSLPRSVSSSPLALESVLPSSSLSSSIFPSSSSSPSSSIFSSSSSSSQFWKNGTNAAVLNSGFRKKSNCSNSSLCYFANQSASSNLRQSRRREALRRQRPPLRLMTLFSRRKK